MSSAKSKSSADRSQPKSGPTRQTPEQLDSHDPDLLEKIVEQFTANVRSGYVPSIEEYQQRFPEHADELDELLSSVAMIEQLKASRSNPSLGRRSLFDQVAALKKIGPYTVIREVGRGGMGIVFEAVHDSLGRRVAIKALPTPLDHGEEYVARFRQEAQAAARLHHTNIVSVFGVGEFRGFHYYVMDFVRGQTIRQVLDWLAIESSNEISPATLIRTAPTRLDLDSEPAVPNEQRAFLEQGTVPNMDSWLSSLPRPGNAEYFRWAASLAAQVADALAYAHAAEILHRDIKPANLMLDREGVIWMTDFGLAKDGACDINLTRTGDVIGTPQYLAPESLEGRYDRRSEIYCLGLTLYELVTRQPAHPPGTAAEIIRSVASHTPPPPRKLDPRLPLDLATIIGKCLHREPDRRYGSAEELRHDLLAFLDDRPIAARRPGWLETIGRWSRQNPLPAALAGLSALLLSLVAVVATVGYISTTNALSLEADKSARLAAQQLATDRARQDAEGNLARMKIQYDRAESNLLLTIEAFDNLFKQVIGGTGSLDQELNIDGFREIAGIEHPLSNQDAELLETLLAYYEQFAELNADNQTLAAESARAYRRVGNLYQMIGEYNPAIAAYRQSMELSMPRWNAAADSKSSLLEQVRVLNELSLCHRKAGHPARAYELDQDCIGQLQSSPLAESDPEVRLELARALTSSGFNLFRYLTASTPPRGTAGQGPRAGPPRPSNPRDPNRTGNEARSRSPFRNRWRPDQLSWLELVRRGRAGIERRNRELIQQATDIVNDLITADPDNTEYHLVRATCRSLLAASLMDVRRPVANQYRNEAVTELQTLIEADPECWEARYLLALASAVHGQPPEPEDAQRLSLAIEESEVLTNQFPHRMEYHQLAVGLKIRLADVHLERGQTDAARASLESARESVETLLGEVGSDVASRQITFGLRNRLSQLARQYHAAGQPRDAEAIERLMRRLTLEVMVRSGLDTGREPSNPE